MNDPNVHARFLKEALIAETDPEKEVMMIGNNICGRVAVRQSYYRVLNVRS